MMWGVRTHIKFEVSEAVRLLARGCLEILYIAWQPATGREDGWWKDPER